MKINKDFIKLTDSLIHQISEKNITFGNGNVLIAKPPVEEQTRGGIIIADESRELEAKRAGFAKVIALPNNMDPTGGDIPVKVGDYVWFTYVADNPLYYKALTEITGVVIPKETLFFTSDSELVAVVDRSEVENERD